LDLRPIGPDCEYELCNILASLSLCLRNMHVEKEAENRDSTTDSRESEGGSHVERAREGCMCER
jgi:hypothetical protein